MPGEASIQPFELHKADSVISDTGSVPPGQVSADLQKTVLKTVVRLRFYFAHFTVLSLIAAVSAGATWLFRYVAVSGDTPPSEFVQFISENLPAVGIAAGFSVYGIIVNRRLQNQLRMHTELGPYTMKEIIGSGGMGVVYLAEHRLLKRLCAVKLLRHDKAGSRHLMQSFEREVKAMAQLTHWNTVQVYDYGRTITGRFYYAMEFLKGLNLRQVVEQCGPLPPSRVIFILRQICGSLHEAAQHGLVHRDIKPSNIFLAERGHVYDVAKLLDFGLVCPACEDGLELRTVNCQLQGSPRFMCPEQARGLNPDCRGDLYSLGCVAYYLLTGRPPFDEENPVLLVVAHGTIPVPTFQEIGANVPEDLSQVIMKCLEKNPDNRYSSPRALLKALDQCECAHEWNWHRAEEWWNKHERTVRSAPIETTVDAADAGTQAGHVSSPVPAAFQEPDPTFVCEIPYTA
ncbi:MAG: serine/threonine protein kinase [Planctomyces sp.]